MSKQNNTAEPEFVSQEFSGTKLSRWWGAFFGLFMLVGAIWLWQRQGGAPPVPATATTILTLQATATLSPPTPSATPATRATPIIALGQPITLTNPDGVIDLGEVMPFSAEWLPNGRGIVTAHKNKIAFYDFPSMQITRTIPLTNPYPRFYDMQMNRTDNELHLYEMSNAHFSFITHFNLVSGAIITRYVNYLTPSITPDKRIATLYNSLDTKWQVIIDTDDWNSPILTNTARIPVPATLNQAIQNCSLTLNTRMLSGKKIICASNSFRQANMITVIDLERLQSYQLTIPSSSPLVKIFAEKPDFDFRLYQLTLSPDERYLAASNYQSVAIWDLNTRSYIGYSHVEPSDGPIYAISLHPDGKTVLISVKRSMTTTDPDFVTIRNLQNQELFYLAQSINRPRYSPNGQFWLGMTNLGLLIFNAKDNTQYKDIPMLQVGTNFLTFHPNSQKLIVSSPFTNPMQYDLRSPYTATLLSDRKLQGRNGQLDDTGRYWIESVPNLRDFRMRVWDLDKQNLKDKDSADYTTDALCVYPNMKCGVLNADSDVFYFSSKKTLSRYHLPNQTLITYTLPFTLSPEYGDRNAYIYTISSNGKWLAISNDGINYDLHPDRTYSQSSADATLELYEINTEVRLQQAFSTTFVIGADKTLVFSADNTRLFIVTRQDIEMIDLTTAQSVYRLMQADIHPYYFQSTTDGRRIAYTNLINEQAPQISIRDICNSSYFFTVNNDNHNLMNAALSPDGRTLATISDDNKIRLWQLPAAKC